MCENQLIEKLKNHCNPFVLSVNIQSLSSKFNDLKSLISSLLISNCAPDVICLQEIWRIPGSEFFNLDGYHPLEFSSRHSNVQGGGVGIFVNKKLNFSANKKLSIFHDRIFESIFIESLLKTKKLLLDPFTVLVPNTPPYLLANNLHNFVNFFQPLLTVLTIVTTPLIFSVILILIV